MPRPDPFPLRFLIGLAILAVAGLGHWLVAAAEPYPCRDIPEGDPRWEKILSAVNASIAEREAGKGTLVEFTILQHVEGDLYLIDVGGDTAAWHSQNPDQLHTDGEALRARLLRAEKPYQYVTVLGAKKTVPLLVFPDVDPLLTLADLIKALRAGETFTIEVAKESVQCKRCLGRGKVGSTLAADGEAVCYPCDGRGRLFKPVYRTLSW